MKFTNKNQNIQKPSQNHSKISATLQLISSEWKILFPHGPLMRGLSTNHHQQECWTISEWSADVKRVILLGLSRGQEFEARLSSLCYEIHKTSTKNEAIPFLIYIRVFFGLTNRAQNTFVKVTFPRRSLSKIYSFRDIADVVKGKFTFSGCPVVQNRLGVQ